MQDRGNILGTFTHYCFIFVLISHFISLILHDHSWKSFKFFLIAGIFSVTPFAIFWYPILQIQLGLNTSSWIPKPKPEYLVKILFDFYHPLFYLILLIPFLFDFKNKGYLKLSALRGFRQLDIKSNIRSYFKEDIVWFYLFAGSFFTIFFISFIKPIFLSRYTIISLFPFAMLISRYLTNITFNNKIITISYLLVIVSVIGFIKTVNEPWYQIPNKTTAQYLIANSRPGDIIIFTHLSRAAMEYYLDRYNCKGKYSLISFPSELAEHIGWTNEIEMLERKSELEDEARNLALKLKDQLDNSNKIWLFLFIHKGFETPKIIKKEIESMFTEVANNTIRGAPFYHRIITYK